MQLGLTQMRYTQTSVVGAIIQRVQEITCWLMVPLAVTKYCGVRLLASPRGFR